MGKLNPRAFVEWLEKQRKDGCGYMMGAVGQYCKDLSVTNWLVAQYKDDAKQYASALKWLNNSPRVFDCQGLADCYVTEQTGVKTNVYARTNYANWCGIKGNGKIPVDKRVPGAAVFTYSSSAGRITHVGFLIKPVDKNKPGGDWYVTEARGVMYGVVRTRLLERSWNRWGLMDKYFDYGTEPAKDYEPGARLLRNGSEGADVREMQAALISLGYDCGHWGADGDFGDATEMALIAFQKDHKCDPDGIYGEHSHKALIAALADDSSPSTPEQVQIIGGNCWAREAASTGAIKMGVAYEGERYEYGGKTSDAGWHLIRYKGLNAWVSGKYGKLVG